MNDKADSMQSVAESLAERVARPVVYRWRRPCKHSGMATLTTPAYYAITNGTNLAQREIRSEMSRHAISRQALVLVD
jgi:hypothetical protein